MKIRVEEFVAARDASRGLGRLIARLEAGELEHVVIVHRNKPRAVLLTVAQYDYETREAQ